MPKPARRRVIKAKAKLVEAGDYVSESEGFVGRHAEVIADQSRKIEELEPAALKGQKFSDNKRGLNRLYREVLAVLERDGRDCRATLVRREIEKKEWVTVKKDDSRLHWIDDQGKQKVTSAKQFDSHVSAIRKLVR